MEKLKKKYYRCIFGEIVGTVVFALILYYYNARNSQAGNAMVVMNTFLILLWLIFFCFRVIPVIRDFAYIRENRCERVTGEIIEHKRVKSGKYSHTYYPIIRDDRTLERIKLIMDYKEAEVGRRYTILYLPHTKLATVEEEHFEEYVIE